MFPALPPLVTRPSRSGQAGDLAGLVEIDVLGGRRIGSGARAGCLDVAIADEQTPVAETSERVPDLGPLAQVIDRCLIKNPAHRTPSAPETTDAPDTDIDAAPPKRRQVERREQLVAALQAHRGNISAVARALGKARSQVQRWLHDYGLDAEQYRDR